MSTTAHLLEQRHALIDLRAARDVLTDHHLSTAELDARIDWLAHATVQVSVRCLRCRTRLLVEEAVDGTAVPNLVLCNDCDQADQADRAAQERPRPRQPVILLPLQHRRTMRHLAVVETP